MFGSVERVHDAGRRKRLTLVAVAIRGVRVPIASRNDLKRKSSPAIILEKYEIGSRLDPMGYPRLDLAG